MKLWAYLINGTPVSTLGKWTSTELGGNSAFKVSSNSSESGYEDISSIENWEKFWTVSGRDYKFMRAEVSALVVAAGWSNLTTAQKAVASRLFVASKAQRDEIYTTEQQISLGLLHHKASVESRTLRYAKASMEVYNRLSPSESKIVINDVTEIGYRYMQYGIEGTVEGDPEGFFDYLEARTETTYTLTGLAAKGYTPSGMTLAELVTRLMDICKLGAV